MSASPSSQLGLPSWVYFAVCLLFLAAQPLQATHIVGGEMTYSHVRGDTFEIQLTVFRDCLNGAPNAFFDNPAAIGVYDKDRVLVDSLFIPFVRDDTLQPTLFDECLVIPPSVCVHRSTYRRNIRLTPRIGGYELVYQRCCRNETINNIIEPLETGATFSVVIEDIALIQRNNSPRFKEWPPIYICADEPILFDHSAVDDEGDSIAYRLCTPLTGGSQGIPQPRPDNQSIPTEVVWRTPFYGLDNMLNGMPGNEPLRIDPVTGLLTGLPNTVGQFVVGICMDEYRDGVLLSSVRRDFQYNVGECGRTTAAFFSPLIQCDSLTVAFENQSIDADTYRWFFNDPGNPGASSTEVNPSFTFSDTGRYEIVLIANPGGFCEDTIVRTIQLLPPSLMPDFSFSYEECNDSLVVQITDLTTDELSTPVAWSWVLTQNAEVIAVDSVQSPRFAIRDPGAVLLTLEVIAANGCRATLSQLIPNPLIGNPLVATDTVVCLGDSLELIPNPDPSYAYQWAPGPDIGNPNTALQIVRPLGDVSYFVTITNADGSCQVERSIAIQVPEVVALSTPPDFETCDPLVELTVSSGQAVTYLWDTLATFASPLSEADTVTVEPFGANTYYVLGQDEFGCEAVDSIEVIGRGINIALPELPPRCPGDTTELFVLLTDPLDTLSYQWSPPDFLLDPPDSATPRVWPPGTGVYTYRVDLENQFQCTRQDSLQLTVLDTTAQLAFLSSQQCGGFEVQFFNSSINAPFIRWNFGDPTDPDAGSTDPDPSYVYPDTGTYQVTLTLDLDVPCKDTTVQTIRIVEPQIEVGFDYSFESCGDSVVVVFQDTSRNDQSTIVDWEWRFSTGETASGPQASITLLETTIINVNLQITSDDGCTDELSQNVIIRLIETFLPDTLQICRGETRGLNPNGIARYEYRWSPSTGLDDPTVDNPLASPLQTTTYTVTVTDFNPDTCQVVRQVTVVVPPDFELTAGEDARTCGEEVLLMASGEGDLEYFWSNEPTFGTILGIGQEFLAAPSRPGLYYLQGIDEFGCPKIDTVRVFDLGIGVEVEPLTICKGDTQQIRTENRYPEDVLTFSWSPVESIISGADTDAPAVAPSENTTYTYDISNENGCRLSGSVVVNIFDFNLPLDIIASPYTIVQDAGESSQLLATDDPFYNYTWRADASLSATDISNPIATPEVTTIYFLDVENVDGCRASDTVIVFVINPICEDPQIFFPSAFSPNGDGENDELQVLGRYIEEMHLIIYNRWGQQVFETRSQDEAWDGTFNGRRLEPDVFGYYLEVRCINGAEFFKKGDVTLLR
ncbi:MAG: PKD domain-containing protein [Bacteroidota bacterium]